MQRRDWRAAAQEIVVDQPTGGGVVVIPRNGDDPLAFYLGAEKFKGSEFRGGIELEELQVLSTRSEIDPPKGFAVIESRRLAPFTLWRLEAERPTKVKPQDLEGDRVLAERSASLLRPTPGT